MFKRLWLAILFTLNLTLAVGPGTALADPAPADTICRRIYGTPEWTRRCAPQRPDESYQTYCRRIQGTDEWTRRCAPQRPSEKFNTYCRRINGTSEWTRRCLPQRPDESYESYCRRIYGSEHWTRRCAPQGPDEDRDSYCRRLYGTDEWTRRCVNATATPELRPTIVEQPIEVRPAEADQATPVPAPAEGGRGGAARP